MEECKCGVESDRVCNSCETPLCDSCDKGTWKDECSLCGSCKDFKSDAQNSEIESFYNQMDKDFKFIKVNHQRALTNLQINDTPSDSTSSLQKYEKPSEGKPEVMLLKKFVAMAELVKWDTSYATSEISGMSNERYRSLRNELHNYVDEVVDIVKDNI